MSEKIKRYNIGGMSCAACSARVEKAVNEVPSVSMCSVNLLTNELTVNYDADEKQIQTAVENAGYVFLNKEEKENFGEEKTQRLRLIISISLLAVILVFMYFKIKWPQAVLALAVMIINRHFFISGFKSAVKLAPNMDTLVALGSAASFIYGYFDSAAMILTLISVGKTLEARAKGKTTDAISSLKKIVPSAKVALGEIFEIKAGESIAADGMVLSGNAVVDESMLTGESIPTDKTEGDTVSAGTICRTGYLKCKATAVGEDTALSKIINLVSDAASTKAPVSKAADKVASVFVPVVIGIAVITTIIWLIAGKEFGFALSRGIAVLVISCPCSLGLATPVAIMVASGKGAKNGILYKTAASIEQCGRVNTVVLDKTGTITKGMSAVTDVIPSDESSREELLKIASILEKKSEHPFAKAIIEYAGEQTQNAENYETLPGIGVRAVIDGQVAAAGKGQSDELSDQGKTPLEFKLGNRSLGIIAVADAIKDDSVEAIKQMKSIGLDVIMLTGDNERTARAIAEKAGIEKVISGVLPDGKENEIVKLQKNGKVAMVGDGINDSPALTRADVGIAIGSGTDIAIDSADVVLMKSKLMDAFAALYLGRKTLKNIHENLFWAFLYNSIGIPLAAGVLSGHGVTLTPALAAACMSMSSFCVVTNALRLNLTDIYKNKEYKRKEYKNKEHKNKGKEKNKVITKTFSVDGMMCPHCEAHVKKAIEDISGVQMAQASHESKCVVVKCDSKVSDDMIKTAIEKAGYKVI